MSHSETTGTKIEWMKKSVAELMGEIRARLEAFESRLPARINAMDVSPTSKLPYKVLLYREALIWRIVELGRAAFENFTTDKLVSGIVLTRAAVETSAALWYLCAKVAGVVDSGTIADVDEYLMKMVMGTATDAPQPAARTGDVKLPRPVKVDAFLKQAEKDGVEGFSYQYGILSEYAHPNWAGTGLLYSKHDKENRTTDFGQNIRKAENTKLVGVANLSVALLMFEKSYDRIRDLLPAFTELSESPLKSV